jgi:hypothetical protein
VSGIGGAEDLPYSLARTLLHDIPVPPGCRGLAVHHLVIKEWQGRTMMMIASMEGHLTVHDMGPAPPGEVIKAANKFG